jgi:hypothetical protein
MEPSVHCGPAKSSDKGEQTMFRVKTIIGTALVSTALLAASVTAVLAHGGGGFPGRGGQGLIGYGTLSTLSASSVTITTPSNASLTATLDAQATYTAHSQAAATAGLKSGDQVALRGSSVNGATTARGLDYDTKPFAAASVRYTGTVSSSSASSLTLTTSGGQSVTVQLTNSTTYVVNGTKASSKPTFAANQQVRVSATLMTDGSLVARSVSTSSS